MEAEERDETKNVGGNTLGKFMYYIIYMRTPNITFIFVNNPRVYILGVGRRSI